MKKYIIIAAAIALAIAFSATAAVAHDPIQDLWDTITEIQETLADHEERLAELESTWRGLGIADEDRCADYDADDYDYPASIEGDIVEGMGGAIYSPYTQEHFDSTDDTDIEHIVARSEAHDSGLCDADDDTKSEFASDLLNLTLASPSINRHEKGGSDAAEWLPEHNQCWFADTVVKVRAKYELTIDRAEADALDEVLDDCESFDMVIVEAPDDEEEETDDTSMSALDLYDDDGNGKISCAEARAHGIAPVNRGHPAYEYMNDADGDGVVCEG